MIKPFFRLIRACITVLPVIALAGMAAAGCGSPKDDGKASTGAAAAGSYKIGVLVSSTGGASWLGDTEARVAKIFADKINAGGGVNGRKIDLVMYDDESDAQKALIGAKKLIEQEKVVAVIGPSLVAAGNAVAPLVKDKGPVVYCLSGGYEPGNEYMFAASAHTRYMQQGIFDWLKSRGMTRIALLAGSDATGQMAVDSIKPWVEQYKFDLVAVERVNVDDVDVTPQMTRIRARQPQALIAWMSGKIMGVVVKNFNQMGFDIPIFISHGNLSYTFLDSIRAFEPKQLYMPATKDIAWQSLPEGDPQKPVNKELHEAYFSKHGKNADFGVVAWDALQLVTDALKKAGPDPKQMKEYIESQKGYTGACGIYDFSAQDHRGTGRKDVVVLRVKDGKFEIAQ